MNDPQENKKAESLRNMESEESSSLQFLGSDKQNEENQNEMDEEEEADINRINVPSKRKKQSQSQSQGASLAQMPRRKQKQSEDDSSIDSTFLYKPGVELPNLFGFTNLTIKVIIAAEYVSKDNPAVLRHHIFGTDTYSSNSDCVCIGIHFGLFGFSSFVSKKYEGVEIVFKVIKPKKNYNGSHKNGIISQTIRNFNGNALKPESSKMLTSLGSIEFLQKCAANMRIPLGKTRVRAKPTNIKNIVALPEANLVFNMNNEPAFKYTIFNIADKGFDKSEFLLRKLDNRVLYLETHEKQRYELYKYIEKTYFEAYRFSKLKHPLKFDNQHFGSHSPPIESPEDVEVLEPVAEWDEILFGASWVKIKDTKIHNVASYKFYTKAEKAQQ